MAREKVRERERERERHSKSKREREREIRNKLILMKFMLGVVADPVADAKSRL
jgi:hypothetical protein